MPKLCSVNSGSKNSNILKLNIKKNFNKFNSPVCGRDRASHLRRQPRDSRSRGCKASGWRCKSDFRPRSGADIGIVAHQFPAPEDILKKEVIVFMKK